MLNLQYHYDWLKRDWFMNMTVYGLVQKLVALLGFLCIFFNILLPVLAFFMRLLFVDVPHEWRVLLLRRAQQHELQRLQRRVDVLTRRKEAEEQETWQLGRATSTDRCL